MLRLQLRDAEAAQIPHREKKMMPHIQYPIIASRWIVYPLFACKQSMLMDFFALDVLQARWVLRKSGEYERSVTKSRPVLYFILRWMFTEFFFHTTHSLVYVYLLCILCENVMLTGCLLLYVWCVCKNLSADASKIYNLEQ